LVLLRGGGTPVGVPSAVNSRKRGALRARLCLSRDREGVFFANALYRTVGDLAIARSGT